MAQVDVKVAQTKVGEPVLEVSLGGNWPADLLWHPVLHLTGALLDIRSSTARQDKTSVTLELHLIMTGFDESLVIFIGTHQSPHINVMTRPTRMSLSLDLEVHSSTTVLPGDTGTLL